MKIRMLFMPILACLLAACSIGSPQDQAASPEEVVRQFYAWFLSDRASGPKDVRNSAFLTQAMFEKVNASYQNAGPGTPQISSVD